jgi:hypothetical protein
MREEETRKHIRMAKALLNSRAFVVNNVFAFFFGAVGALAVFSSGELFGGARG